MGVEELTAEERQLWVCVICGRGRPSGELKPGVADNWATGSCNNLDCPSKKDEGATKRKGALNRPPRQATFRRTDAKT